MKLFLRKCKLGPTAILLDCAMIYMLSIMPRQVFFA